MKKEKTIKAYPMYQYKLKQLPLPNFSINLHHDMILNKKQAKMLISWLKKLGEKVKLKDLEILK